MEHSRRENLRYAAALILLTLSTVIWDITGRAELYYAELGALCTGLLLVDKHIWAAGRLQVLTINTLGAALGVLFATEFGQWSMAVSIPVAFTLTGIAVLLCGAAFAPALASCLFPLFFGFTSWDYVAAVAFYTAVTLGAQWVLELMGARSYRPPVVSRPIWSKLGLRALRWVLVGIAALPLAFAAHSFSSWSFLAAPPIMVTLAEFSITGSGFRRRPWQVLFLMMFGAALGSFSIVTLAPLGVDPAICVMGGAAFTMAAFYFFGKTFAPACSACMLTLLVPESQLWTYALQVGLGGAYAIAASAVVWTITYRLRHPKGE